MSLESAVSKTLSYAKNYGCSLTRQECEDRLIGNMIYDLRFTNGTFKEENDNKYFKKKLELAEDLAKNHLSKFEDILMVGVTGSVASKYPRKNDDIDLMIVTKSNKLWLTRFKLKIYLLANKINHRKLKEKHEKNKYCFNLWMDQAGLEIPQSKRNLKNAIDAILMIPLVNKNSIYGEFLIKNRWIMRYVATGYSKKAIKDKVIKQKDAFSLVNWGLYWGQYLYMRNKVKREIINYHQAFFHPNG